MEGSGEGAADGEEGAAGSPRTVPQLSGEPWDEEKLQQQFRVRTLGPGDPS